MADTPVDRLKIEIEASASKAEDSVDKLIQYVESLRQAVDNIDTSRLYALSGAITSLSDGMKNMPSSSAFNNLVKGIERLKGIDTSGIDSVARSVSNLTNARPESLEDLAIGITDMSQAVGSLPSAQSFNGLVTGLNSLNNVNFSNLENLANSLSGIGNAVGELSGFTNAINNASEAMGNFTNNAQNFANASQQVPQDANSAGNAVGRMSGVLGGFANALGNTANAVRSAFSNVASVVGNTAATAFRGLTSAVRNFVGFTATAIGRLGSMYVQFLKVSTGFKLFANAVKQAGSALTKLTGKLSKVTRLFTFMLLRRGITALFSEMGTAFQHLARKSETFNASISELKANCSQFSHEIASLVANLLDIFGPALNYIINLITVAVSAINKLFGALAGNTAVTQAKKVATDYAASLDKASKSAKALTGGIDELNILSDNSSSSGSGSSLEDCYETIDIPDEILDTAEWFKNMWEDSDFTELGNRVGEGLANIFNNIPWDTIKEKASNLGKDLATLINGAIETEELGYSIGDTLAQGINTAFSSLNSFVHTLDWGGVGQFIADSVNGLFENIDWTLINDTFVTSATGIADAINSFNEKLNIDAVSDSISNFFNTIVDSTYAFVTTIDWRGIGSNCGKLLSDAFTSIDWVKAGVTVGESFKGFFNFISSTIEAVDWWQVGECVKDFLVSIDWNGVADSFFEAVGAALGGLAAFIGGLLSDAVDDIGNFFADKITEAGGDVGQGLINGIGEALADIGIWIYDHVFTPFIDGFKEAFGIHSPSTVMKEMGGYLIQGLLDGINSLVGKVTLKWQEMKTTATTIWTNVKTSISNIINNIKTKITTKLDEIKTTWSEAWTNVKTATSRIFGEIWDNIKGVINSILGGVESMANGVVKGINTVINALNNLHFEIPDWVPELGGKSFGFNINTLNEITIPRLAEGGLISPNSPFLAMLGDNKSEPEIVSPLSTMIQAVKMALDEYEPVFNVNVSSGVGDAIADSIERTDYRLDRANYYGNTDMKTILSDLIVPYLDDLLDAANKTTSAVEDNRNISVEIDGRNIAKAIDKANRTSGYTFATSI